MMVESAKSKFPDEAISFFSNYINLDKECSFVNYSETENEQPLNSSEVKNIANFFLINDVRYINKYFRAVNESLKTDHYLCGRVETFSARQSKYAHSKVKLFRKAYSLFDFVVHRVFPKLWGIKKIYFLFTKGQSRLLSKAEVFGRLVCCGFEIAEYRDIDSVLYFVARKKSEPKIDFKPSYGPIFKMKRIGKNGKVFYVYKFRTMHPYSEYLQDFVLKNNGYSSSGKPAKDFRLTPWGKMLRRYWLDEVPQLINVLRGEMKLVGVRPVSERYFQDIPEDLQKLRMKQKPGCIPPYLSLGLKSNVNDVQKAEREYLEEKFKRPYTTDFRYFYKALYHIIVKKKRSA